MKLSTAKRLLPAGAKGLVEGCSDLSELRQKVRKEIGTYYLGDNPLSEKQALQLNQFLRKTEVLA